MVDEGSEFRLLEKPEMLQQRSVLTYAMVPCWGLGGIRLDR